MMIASGRRHGFTASERRADLVRWKSSRKGFCAAAALLLLFALASCSSTGTGTGIVEGKALLDEGKYPQAKSAFLKNGEDKADVVSLAFAATAAYKAKDIPEAARLLDAADKIRQQGGALLRIAGYKCLVLLAQGKETAGLDGLKRYIDLYNSLAATMVNTAADTRDIEHMLRGRRVDMANLETIMDRQIDSYEEEYRQVSRAGMRQSR